MKETYKRVLELLNNAKEILYCSDEDKITIELYEKINDVTEYIYSNDFVENVNKWVKLPVEELKKELEKRRS